MNPRNHFLIIGASHARPYALPPAMEQRSPAHWIVPPGRDQHYPADTDVIVGDVTQANLLHTSRAETP
jgi:hypothetical protein